MELHTLPTIGSKKKRRLGQGHGSGRVKTAGRGTKGQKARGKIPLRFEGGALALIKRLPFQRGKDKNKPLRKNPVVLNLSDLAKLSGKDVTLEALLKQNLVSSEARVQGVKLLGNGDVSKAYTVKIPVSKSAAEKITKAGGQVE